MSAEPANPQPHIGQELRQRREAAGKTHAQISAELRIQAQFLDAIEKLDKAALPSIGYVLGYVRAYAMHLGMNGKDAVERYKIDSEVPENLGMRTSPHFVPQRQIRLPRGFFAATAILCGGAVLALWYSAQSEQRSQALNVQSGLNIAETNTAEPQPVDPDLMAFKATAPTWIQIKNSDGKTIISRILITGESWQTDVNNNVSLSARDSGALELYLGGEFIGRLGRKGIPMTDVPMPAVPREFAADALNAAEAPDTQAVNTQAVNTTDGGSSEGGGDPAPSQIDTASAAQGPLPE